MYTLKGTVMQGVSCNIVQDAITGFIRGILRGVRYAKSLRVLFLHRRSPSWTTLVLYSRAVFIFNEPTTCLSDVVQAVDYGGQVEGSHRAQGALSKFLYTAIMPYTVCRVESAASFC